MRVNTDDLNRNRAFATERHNGHRLPTQQTRDSGLIPDSDPGPDSRSGQSAPVPGGPERIAHASEHRKPSGPKIDSRGAVLGPEHADDDEPPRYFDVAALLAGKLPEPPEPDVLQRIDGHRLLYRGQVNVLFGDPESGKTFVALAAVAEAVNAGRSALVLDLDHNGGEATVARLLMLGASRSALTDADRFRYCEPENSSVINAVVANCTDWRPDIAIVDSLGELLPMYGANSNNADDFTHAHTRVLKPLAKGGAAVVVIDHLAKNQDSRAKGPGGTAAKRRALGGTSLRVKAMRPFAPGKGGTALLLVNKDRHGGVRRYAAPPEVGAEQSAGTFVLASDAETRDGIGPWRVLSPRRADHDPDEVDPALIRLLDAADPPPRTAEEARRILGINKDRANRAYRAWRERNATTEGETA